MAAALDAHTPALWRWRGRPVKWVDDSATLMADTVQMLAPEGRSLHRLSSFSCTPASSCRPSCTAAAHTSILTTAGEESIPSVQSDLISEVAEFLPRYREPMTLIRDQGNEHLHPRKNRVNNLLFQRQASAKEVVEKLVEVVEALYGVQGKA